MDKPPPANAGDTGLVPGPGRLHMLQSKPACSPVLSQRAAATEALEPSAHRARAPKQEKPRR